jgi:hypothetical protein
VQQDLTYVEGPEMSHANGGQHTTTVTTAAADFPDNGLLRFRNHRTMAGVSRFTDTARMCRCRRGRQRNGGKIAQQRKRQNQCRSYTMHDAHKIEAYQVAPKFRNLCEGSVLIWILVLACFVLNSEPSGLHVKNSSKTSGVRLSKHIRVFDAGSEFQFRFTSQKTVKRGLIQPFYKGLKAHILAISCAHDNRGKRWPGIVGHVW